ncbi:MAG TPA: hypothetical protein VKI41_06215 [Vicinamibacteria bacterium]|nr:hypothetical protein [Vicinamibacteria bacterium]
MKALELTESPKALSECAKEARKETVVLTRRGKPVAAVVGVGGLDWEDLVVGSDPDFLALIARSRRLYKPGTGIPLEEMRRRYGLPAQPRRRRTARPHHRAR